MSLLRRLLRLSPVLLLAACEPPSAPEAPPPAPDPDLNLLGARRLDIAVGQGTFDAGVVVNFAFSAIGIPDRNAIGAFRFETELGGLPVEFDARVTCLAVDRVNDRAWVGGVVTRNESTHPSFTTPIHQVGRDIWFRVVDYGFGPNDPADRTTFVGFEGAAGIITSAEYCERRIWPGPDSDPPEPQDARTGPVLTGNIFVR
jgi:hypothetical protein